MGETRRILVTGATGFLGQVICRRLRADGHDVIGFGRDLRRGAQLTELGAQFVRLDLSDLASHDPGPAAAVIHAGALSSAWGSAAAFQQANVEGTRAAIAMARRSGARRFVLISSPSVLFRFADQIDLTETAPLPRPVNVYAASKAIAETLVLAAKDIGPVVLRPRAIYGAGDTALLPRLIRAARRGPLPRLRAGRAITSLTHVEDAAEAAILSLSDAPGIAGEIFHIAGPEDVPISRVVMEASAAAGVEVRWRDMPWWPALAGVRLLEGLALLTPGRPEPPITAYGLGILGFSQTLSIDKARQRLDYRPKIDFAEGLARSFAPRGN